MGRNANKGREVSKMGRAEAIPTGIVYFQRYHCLSVFVCSVGTWEKSTVLRLQLTSSELCNLQNLLQN